MSLTIWLHGREWEIVRQGECEDRACNSLCEIRDRFSVGHWLRQLKSDVFSMGAFRKLVADSGSAFPIHRATDDDIIDRVAWLLASGVWHMHAAGSAARQRAGPWKQIRGAPPIKPRPRKTWLLKTSIANCQIVRVADLVPGDWILADPNSMLPEILAWSKALDERPALEEIYTAAYGRRNSIFRSRAASWLILQIESAFRLGMLAVVREQTQTGGGGGSSDDKGAPDVAGRARGDEDALRRRNRSNSLDRAFSGRATAADPSPRPKRQSQSAATAQEKTWFRMRLLDEDGDPMAGEDYVLVDSEGAQHKGKLDDNGEVYIPPILPPGNCTVRYPNIHLNPRKRK